MFQFQRRTDVEMGLVFRAEDIVHVLVGCVINQREMAGDRLDRTRLVVFGDHQHRRDMDRPVSRRPAVDIAHERVGDVRRVVLDIRAGAHEFDIGQHTEEALVFTMYHHITPDGQVFDRLAAFQLDHQPLRQRSPDHDAQTVAIGPRHQGASL